MSYRNSVPLVLPDTGFVKAESLNPVSCISISQDLNKYFPSKQYYFIYEEPLQWIMMSYKNKALKAELLEL